MLCVQAENEAGGVEGLELTREGFYQIVSLVDEKDWDSPLITAPHKAKAAAAAAGKATSKAASAEAKQ